MKIHIKQALAAAMLATSAATAYAQSQNMVVHHKDGQKTTIAVGDIKDITFGKEEAKMFDISVTDIGAARATATVKPAEGAGAWVAECAEKTLFDRYEDDDSLFAYLKKKYENEAFYNGVTYPEYVEQMLLREGEGTKALNGLMPATEYVVAVFAMDKEGQFLSSTVRKPFTTASVEMKQMSFGLQAQLTGDQQDSRVTFNPSDTSQPYFAWLFEKSVYDKYKDKPNPVDYLVRDEMERRAYSRDDVINYVFRGTHVGKIEYNFNNLKANTQYVACAVAMNGDYLSSSNTETFEITSGQRPQSDNQITIDVTEIDNVEGTAKISVKTTNNDKWWPVVIQLPDDSFEDDDYCRDLVESGAQSGIEPVKQGDLEWTYYLYPGDFGIVVAGVDDNGHVNTKIFRKTFTIGESTQSPAKKAKRVVLQGTNSKAPSHR